MQKIWRALIPWLFHRSEAKGVPNLLVAPSCNEKIADAEEAELYEDHETGYYEDGAYVALPDLSSAPTAPDYEDGDDEDIDPQEAYYASLSDRFREIRTVLHSSPPTSNFDKPYHDSLSVSTQAAFLHNATHREWRYQILHTTPSMRLLASTHQDGVVRGLSRLETLLPKKDLLVEIQGNRIGAWCWGLLGRCREIGEMGSEEVGVLRILGKTALRMGKKLRMQKRGGLGAHCNAEADTDGDNDDEEEPEEEPEEARQEVVNGVEHLEQKEDRNRQVQEEMEEGEVDEDEAVGESTDIGDHNGNVDVAVPEGDKRDAPATERWIDKDIPMETAVGAVSMDNSVPKSRTFDGLAQYETVKDPLALAKESLLARVCSPAPSASAPEVDHRLEDNSDGGLDVEDKAFATLDMIVTIVGEFYGQKDLLDAREVWGE